MRTRRIMAIVAALLLAVVAAGCGPSGDANSGTTTYNVSGRIVDSGGRGVADVSIAFSGTTSVAKTDSGGHWSKTGLIGSVTTTPAKDGWKFDPNARTVNGVSTSVNFTASPIEPANVVYAGDGNVKGYYGITNVMGGTVYSRAYQVTMGFSNAGDEAGDITINLYADGALLCSAGPLPVDANASNEQVVIETQATVSSDSQEGIYDSFAMTLAGDTPDNSQFPLAWDGAFYQESERVMDNVVSCD